jgi:hypothetical protein
VSARFEDRLRARSGWRPELVVPERPDPKAKCAYAEAFEQRLGPLLAALPEQAAKVPTEQVDVLFNQMKVHVYDAWEACTLEAPARHTNVAGRRSHPCVDDAAKAAMGRLRELRSQLIVPRLDLRRKAPATRSTPITPELVQAAMGIRMKD